MRKSASAALALAAVLTLPGIAPAQAQLAYTAKNAHLRAGPARDYPVVAILPAGLEIAVQGCLSDYSWCDVIAGPSRGWMYAGNIVYAYNGTYVPLITYGPEIGIGIIGFMLLDYWTAHYHDRPWYRDRDEWVHRHGPGWPARPYAGPRPPGPGISGGPPHFDRGGPGEPHRPSPQPRGDHPQPHPPQAQRPQPSQPRGPAAPHPAPAQPRAPGGPGSPPPRGGDRGG